MSDPSRLNRRYSTMVVAALSLIVMTCLAFLVPVPYVTLRPGPVFDTLGEFDGKPTFAFGDDVKTYPTEGTLDFTTVSVTRADDDLALADAVRAWFNSDVAVVPKSLVYPDEQTAEDSTEESAAQLSSSKDSSQVAALRAAGYDVPATPTIIDVAEDGAAEGILETGDLVETVDGEDVASQEETVEAVSDREPGDEVEIGLVRDGEPVTVQITTKADAQDETVPRIGVGIGSTYDFPIEITNNVGSEIGGPSAGSMFALAIYDRLTPGELTGGKRIAGTGEITPDGVVGPIGGVRQKMAGANADDIEIFLVPAANCGEAADGTDFGMTLVKVETLDDAIDSLEALADDPEAEVPSCS